jgi:hypothetical protein
MFTHQQQQSARLPTHSTNKQSTTQAFTFYVNEHTKNGAHANVEWIRISTPKVAQGVIPLEQINIRVGCVCVYASV